MRQASLCSLALGLGLSRLAYRDTLALDTRDVHQQFTRARKCKMAKKSRKNLLKKKQTEDESRFRDTVRTLDVIPSTRARSPYRYSDSDESDAEGGGAETANRSIAVIGGKRATTVNACGRRRRRGRIQFRVGRYAAETPRGAISMVQRHAI